MGWLWSGFWGHFSVHNLTIITILLWRWHFSTVDFIASYSQSYCTNIFISRLVHLAPSALLINTVLSDIGHPLYLVSQKLVIHERSDIEDFVDNFNDLITILPELWEYLEFSFPLALRQVIELLNSLAYCASECSAWPDHNYSNIVVDPNEGVFSYSVRASTSNSQIPAH